MIRSRDWPAIERLPKPVGVVEMTSTGYVIDGQTVRTVTRKPEPMPTPSFFQRVCQRLGRGG